MTAKPGPWVAISDSTNGDVYVYRTDKSFAMKICGMSFYSDNALIQEAWSIAARLNATEGDER